MFELNHAVTLRTRRLRTFRIALTSVALSALLAGCGSMHWPSVPSVSMPYIPLVHPAPPDLTPARDSADNMVRLDASLRSGCPQVLNIDRPPVTPETARSDQPQRWVAHTCRGDLAYNVVTEKTAQGPVVKVLPLNALTNLPMNPNTIPAKPDE